jgi:ABC-type Na+ efflux pump permease subunit
MLSGSGFIARAALRNMLRSRETILWVFVMPVVFFYFIGTITGGFGSPRRSAGAPEPLVLEAPANAGLLVDEVARKLQAQNFEVRRVAAGDGPAQASRVLVLPDPASGRPFTEAVLDGERQKVTYRTRSEGPTAQFEQLRVARAVYGLVADLAVVTAEGQPVESSTLRALDSAPRPVQLHVESAGRRVRAPTGFEQAIPGTMVMFTMLVSLTSGAILLVIERRRGLLRRLASTPISRSAVVAGKWTGRLVLATVQIAFAMLTGTLLFRMDWGATLPMVVVVLLAWAAFNASLALLLGSLARTEGQMVGLGVLGSMALAALGGCWWPIEITPRWMQGLALFLPTGWAMDAMHRLVSFGDAPGAVLPHVAALVAGTLLLGWAAIRVFRYE